jgi:hypothetical protein
MFALVEAEEVQIGVPRSRCSLSTATPEACR